MTCETCGHDGDLSPCPCGLGGECPVQRGVCDACRRVIARNAAQRRGQRSAA